MTQRFRSSLLKVIVIALLVGLLSSAVRLALAAAPGSAQDPLVSQSYFEDYVEKSFAPLYARLEQLSASLGREIILTIGNREALVDGSAIQLSASPQIMGAGYTMVPARFIGETLGLDVSWDASKREVRFTGNGRNMQLTIGSTAAMIDGQSFTMPYPPVIQDGHTLVHVRFISESCQCSVKWDPASRRVTIKK